MSYTTLAIVGLLTSCAEAGTLLGSMKAFTDSHKVDGSTLVSLRTSNNSGDLTVLTSGAHRSGEGERVGLQIDSSELWRVCKHEPTESYYFKSYTRNCYLSEITYTMPRTLVSMGGEKVRHVLGCTYGTYITASQRWEMGNIVVDELASTAAGIPLRAALHPRMKHHHKKNCCCISDLSTFGARTNGNCDENDASFFLVVQGKDENGSC